MKKKLLIVFLSSYMVNVFAQQTDQQVQQAPQQLAQQTPQQAPQQLAQQTPQQASGIKKVFVDQSDAGYKLTEKVIERNRAKMLGKKPR